MALKVALEVEKDDDKSDAIEGAMYAIKFQLSRRTEACFKS